MTQPMGKQKKTDTDPKPLVVRSAETANRFFNAAACADCKCAIFSDDTVVDCSVGEFESNRCPGPANHRADDLVYAF